MALLYIFKPMNFSRRFAAVSSAVSFASVLAVSGLTAAVLAVSVLAVPAAAQTANAQVKLLPPDKTEFMEYCMENGVEFVGQSTAQSVCTCAYGKVVADVPRYNKMFEVADEEAQFIGYEFFVECAPDEYNATMKKALVNACIDNGIPKGLCPCIVDAVTEQYGVKELLNIVVNDRNELTKILAVHTTKCMIGI